MGASKTRIAVSAAVFLWVCQAAAQQTSAIELSTDEAQCISDHKNDYLAVKRALVAVVPEICPDTGAMAVMRLAQNSSTDRSTRVYWLNQPQLRCLVENIEQLLKQDARESVETDTENHDSDGAAAISVSLECSD